MERKVIKIEKVIKTEDVMQLQLQFFARNILKKEVHNQKNRKEYLYTILNDEKIQRLLKEGKLEDAKVYVNQWIKTI